MATLSLAASHDTSTTALRNILVKIQKSLNRVTANTGGLAIKAATSPTVKTVNAVNYHVDGQSGTLAAADMAALAGTVATTKFGAWLFVVDAAGTQTTVAVGLAYASAAAALVAIQAAYADSTDALGVQSKALIGYVIVQNATGSDFVGGTTNLDTASITATYVNTPGVNMMTISL